MNKKAVVLIIDGERIEFTSWDDVHSEYGDWARGTCHSDAHECCCHSYKYSESCDCSEECARACLDSNHVWNEVKEGVQE